VRGLEGENVALSLFASDIGKGNLFQSGHGTKSSRDHRGGKYAWRRGMGTSMY